MGKVTIDPAVSPPPGEPVLDVVILDNLEFMAGIWANTMSRHYPHHRFTAVDASKYDTDLLRAVTYGQDLILAHPGVIVSSLEGVKPVFYEVPNYSDLVLQPYMGICIKLPANLKGLSSVDYARKIEDTMVEAVSLMEDIKRNGSEPESAPIRLKRGMPRLRVTLTDRPEMSPVYVPIQAISLIYDKVVDESRGPSGHICITGGHTLETVETAEKILARIDAIYNYDKSAINTEEEIDERDRAR